MQAAADDDPGVAMAHDRSQEHGVGRWIPSVRALVEHLVDISQVAFGAVTEATVQSP